MTHQCLNCGRIIEKGSDEILKGCSQCSGKKFIFVSSPLPQEKRMDLIRRAETVREEMVRKADPELLRVLRERGVTEIDGKTLELERSSMGDWVRIRPGPAAPIPSTTPPSEKAATSPAREPEAGPEVRKPSAREIIFEFDEERRRKEAKTSKGKGAGRPTKKPPSKRKAKEGTKRRVMKGKRKAKIGPSSPSGPPVGTVNVIEAGVYEIDVERLLRDDPVIIENDGSYLIHLQSLFKDVKQRKDKR